MNLAVDGSCWGGHERGVAVSTRRLWRAVLRRDDAPRPTMFARSALAAQLEPARVIDVGPFTGPRRFVWQQAVLPRLLREHQVDLLHCPSYTAPVAARCRTIVTIHDLIAWTHPHLAGWRNALHLRTLVGCTVHHASAICVPTKVVARDVVATFGVPRSKVFVVAWGVDEELVPRPREAATRDVAHRFEIREPFALFCGCIEPKKNVSTAIDAVRDAGISLVTVGPTIASSRSTLQRGPVRHLGYVSGPELSALYCAATALLAPSIVEGFGMPTIEAMRCGCPVVASDIPALREVCGDAAIFAPFDNPGQFAAALRSIMMDAVYRTELVGRGRERAAQFSWQSSAASFSSALQHATRS